jgi:hypothetical protein
LSRKFREPSTLAETSPLRGRYRLVRPLRPLRERPPCFSERIVIERRELCEAELLDPLRERAPCERELRDPVLLDPEPCEREPRDPVLLDPEREREPFERELRDAELLDPERERAPFERELRHAELLDPLRERVPCERELRDPEPLEPPRERCELRDPERLDRFCDRDPPRELRDAELLDPELDRPRLPPERRDRDPARELELSESPPPLALPPAMPIDRGTFFTVRPTARTPPATPSFLPRERLGERDFAPRRWEDPALSRRPPISSRTNSPTARIATRPVRIAFAAR